MPKAVRGGQRPKRAHRIDKERMAPVEGVDIAAGARKSRPAGCLYGTAGQERQFVVLPFILVRINLSLVGQSQKVSVSANVVEAVVMPPDVRQVFRHVGQRVAAAVLEEPL